MTPALSICHPHHLSLQPHLHTCINSNFVLAIQTKARCHRAVGLAYVQNKRNIFQNICKNRFTLEHLQ